MVIFTFQGTNLYNNTPISDVFLDYALVSSPPPGSTTKRSRTPLAAMLGGTLGGVASIIAVILAVFYYRNRNRKPVEIDPEPIIPPTPFITSPNFQPDHLYSTTLQPGGGSTHPQTDSSWVSPMPLSPTRPSKVTATANVPTSSMSATLQSQNFSSSQLHQPAEAEAIARAFVASTHTPMVTHPAGTPTYFTEQQTELVQSMIRNNVSISAVAGVIEGMLRREGLSGSGEGSSNVTTQRDGRVEAENPPGYSF